jgi:hypothetical protein
MTAGRACGPVGHVMQIICIPQAEATGVWHEIHPAIRFPPFSHGKTLSNPSVLPSGNTLLFFSYWQCTFHSFILAIHFPRFSSWTKLSTFTLWQYTCTLSSLSNTLHIFFWWLHAPPFFWQFTPFPFLVAICLPFFPNDDPSSPPFLFLAIHLHHFLLTIQVSPVSLGSIIPVTIFSFFTLYPFLLLIHFTPLAAAFHAFLLPIKFPPFPLACVLFHYMYTDFQEALEKIFVTPIWL